ncbi:MAG: hypothetical protein M0C28_25010 [Candidatus Moduliflexus flocculans]|nr:hypothetical protein [Candidatus Moduliflexus flocculans]
MRPNRRRSRRRHRRGCPPRHGDHRRRQPGGRLGRPSLHGGLAARLLPRARPGMPPAAPGRRRSSLCPQPGAKGEVSLIEIYTDLDVVSAPRAADEAASRWGLRLARGEGGERTPLLPAIAEPLGAPSGAGGRCRVGKTTFVNYVAYGLAEALAGGTPPCPARRAARRAAGAVDPAARRPLGSGG